VSYVAPLTPPTFVPPPPPPPPLAPVVAPVVPVAHITPPAPPAAPKQENPFVSIGTQEQVQPAASATATIKPGLPALSTRPAVPVRQAPIVEAPVPETPKIEFPNMQDTEIVAPFEEVSAPAMSNVQSFTSSPAAAPLTLSELRGDEPTPTVNASVEAATATLEQAPLAEEKPAESSRAVFGSLSGGGFGSNRAASKESFGARLDGGLGSSDEPKREGRSSNWMLIAACVSVLFAGIVGGAFYLRSQSSGAAANGSSSAQSTQQSQQVAAEQDALQNSASRTAVSGPMATVVPSSVPAVTVSANASNSTAKPNLVAKPPVSKTAALMDSATIEHPLTAQRTDALVSAAAPSFDVPAPESSNGNALPGVISSSSMANPAVPEIRTEGPVVIGGQVAEPKLLYRAMPVYPLGAKQSGVQGDVVIKTTVDQKGSVVDMHVVSGPAMLRQAALDALRRWKYEPSKLNGQPISVQMLVTLKFSR
jgi:TonB family protein